MPKKTPSAARDSTDKTKAKIVKQSSSQKLTSEKEPTFKSNEFTSNNLKKSSKAKELVKYGAKNAVENYQKGLEQGDFDGVKVVSQGISQGTKTARRIMQNNKANKTPKNKLSKTNDKSDSISQKNQAAKIRKYQQKNVRPATQKFVLNKKNSEVTDLKLKRKTSNRQRKFLKEESGQKFNLSKNKPEKAEKLTSVTSRGDKVEKFQKKQRSNKNLQKKSEPQTTLKKKDKKESTAKRKKGSTLKKITNIPTSIAKEGVVNAAKSYQKGLEQSDFDGVKVVSQGISKGKTVTKKLLNAKKKSKAKKTKSVKQNPPRGLKKETPKLSNKTNVDKQARKAAFKKNMKKKTYKAVRNKEKTRKLATSVSERIKNLFISGKNSIAAIVDNMKAKLFAAAGSGLLVGILVFAVPISIITVVSIIGAATSPQYEEVTSQNVNLSPEVEKWRSLVSKVASENGMEQYVNLILAIIQVESGGKGRADIMQSSESAGLAPNSFTTEEQSVKQGVKYLKAIIDILNGYGKGYETNLKLIAQSYNYGSNFARYVGNRGGEYSIDVAELYSKTVVAPSLGNKSGITYPYINTISVSLGKPYLYLNGGNFMYGDLVGQYLNVGGGQGAGDTSVLAKVLGQRINNGQCYGLTAYYVEQMGGPKMMGSGFMNAGDIGTDYDWGKYGWQVILNPKPSDIQPGDVINWNYPGPMAPQIYGHTGVVRAVEQGGSIIHTYEQNAGKGQVCAEYTRTYNLSHISSVVRKIK